MFTRLLFLPRSAQEAIAATAYHKSWELGARLGGPPDVAALSSPGKTPTLLLGLFLNAWGRINRKIGSSMAKLLPYLLYMPP